MQVVLDLSMLVKHSQVAVRGADPGFDTQVCHFFYFSFKGSHFSYELINQPNPFKHVFPVARVMSAKNANLIQLIPQLRMFILIKLNISHFIYPFFTSSFIYFFLRYLI